MKLRTKVLLAILMAWLLMLLAMYLGTRQILINSYLKLENHQAISNLNRVNKAINQVSTGLSALVANWAVWNDAYQFIIDKNQAFVTSNMTVPIFLTSDLDIILIYDTTGNLVLGYGLNAERNKQASVSDVLLNSLKPGGIYGKIIENPKIDSNAMGLLSDDKGIIYFASHSVVTSEGKGPPHGTMIMMRYLDDQEINKLKKTTKLDLIIYNLNKIKQDASLSKLFSTLVSTKKPLLERKSKMLSIFDLEYDNNKQPVGMVSITMPRSVYLFGLTATFYFNLIFLFAGLVVLLILLYLLNIFVLKRLERINQEIINISATKNFLPIVHEEGNDEITSLEKETNKMLSTIHEYNLQKETILNKIGEEVGQVNKFSDQLKESENFLTHIINSILSVLIITDKNFKIFIINHQAENELQVTADEVKSKSLFEIFPYLEIHKNIIIDAFNKHTTFTLDKIAYTKEKETYYYNIIFYPLIYDEDEFLVIRVDDISEQIKLEERLVQSDKLASIGLLTASISHEINNPINFLSVSIKPLKENILALINLINMYKEIKSSEEFTNTITKIKTIQASLDLDYLLKETYELLDGIKSGADRVATIVNNLRTFFRLDEGTKKPSDINAGIESTLKLLHYKYAKRHIHIEKNLGHIPKVVCFPGKINQVIMNIISNAIEAIPNEGKIIITTECGDDKNILIHIKDSGVGISKENIDKIFNPFFSTKAAGKGAGLGLSISDTIIREHNGSIEVKSQFGEGTEFIITLPIAQ